MSAVRSSSRSPQNGDDSDDLPPPYTLRPTDEVTLEVGPARPFQPPPQQPPPSLLHHRQNREHSRQLSDFAREFYAAGDTRSQSAESHPFRPPPSHSQSRNTIPDDGTPTRTPVPGRPLLHNGKTLVYPPNHHCSKCMFAVSPKTLR